MALASPVLDLQSAGRLTPADSANSIRRMATKPAVRPWRRHLRVSVRALLVFVLLVGAWLGSIVHNARVQREAVAAIQKVGGKVCYNWEWTGGVMTPGGKPRVPAWLIGSLGVDYFGHVTKIDLVPYRNPDSQLHQIGRLRQLEWLQIGGDARVTDDDIASLEGLSNLQALLLYAPDVTDGGLMRIARLSRLERLELQSSSITDNGLRNLQRLSNLRNPRLERHRNHRLGGGASSEANQATEPGTLEVQDNRCRPRATESPDQPQAPEPHRQQRDGRRARTPERAD